MLARRIVSGVKRGSGLSVNPSHALAPDYYYLFSQGLDDLAGDSTIALYESAYQDNVEGLVAPSEGDYALITGIPAFGTGDFHVVMRATVSSDTTASFPTFFGRSGSPSLMFRLSGSQLSGYSSGGISTTGSVLSKDTSHFVSFKRNSEGALVESNGTSGSVDATASYNIASTDVSLFSYNNESIRFMVGAIKWLAVYIGRSVNTGDLYSDEYQFLV